MSQRKSDPEIQRAHLEQKKAKLDATVQAMSNRKALSASEELEEKQLKKQKLAMKDQLKSLG